jgi:imidazolonepropionase-like amidohydrolase
MVTLHPANAIGLAGQLGIIAVGARADFIAIPFDGRRKEATSAVVHHAEPIAWMMVDGLLKNQSYSD